MIGSVFYSSYWAAFPGFFINKNNKYSLIIFAHQLIEICSTSRLKKEKIRSDSNYKWCVDALLILENTLWVSSSLRLESIYEDIKENDLQFAAQPPNLLPQIININNLSND